MTQKGKNGDRKATAIRFPKDLHAEAMKVADERDTSINHLCIKALSDYLKRLPPLEPEETPRAS